MMKLPTLVALGLVLGSMACSASTLDGGSTAGGADASADAALAASDIPARPLEGSVAGKAFTPKAVDIRYDVSCGVSKAPATGPELMIITVADFAPAAGTEKIAYGDGHAATFQIGVYEKGKGEPDARPATAGVLRIDTWSDVPGASVGGALRLTGEGSEVAGTFTATVCAPR
jgi:hypothetical protein